MKGSVLNGLIIHPIKPIFDDTSEILILGSFPSVKSREQTFFYGHPQNRFWKVLSAVLGRSEPKTVEEKTAFLLSSKIAVWDVIGSCDIVGSADSTIKNATPNDLSVILTRAPIRRIFVNGKTALKYYNALIADRIGLKAVYLPSTSPANARLSLPSLISAWKVISE